MYGHQANITHTTVDSQGHYIPLGHRTQENALQILINLHRNTTSILRMHTDDIYRINCSVNNSTLLQHCGYTALLKLTKKHKAKIINTNTNKIMKIAI